MNFDFLILIIFCRGLPTRVVSSNVAKRKFRRVNQALKNIRVRREFATTVLVIYETNE